MALIGAVRRTSAAALSALCLLAVFAIPPVAQASDFYATVGGQRSLVITPARPTDRLALYVHSAGGSADAITEWPVDRLTETLLRSGFAVAASDAHGPTNWGNPASVADYVHLVHRLPYERIYVIAQSMGGLDAVQLIDRIHPEAWAALFPVCNVDSLGPEFSEEIAAAWNGWPPPSLSPVKAEDVDGLRVLIWASPEDQLVPKAQNADVCARWMRHRGARVRVVATEGEHADPSNFRPDWLARFFRGR